MTRRESLREQYNATLAICRDSRGSLGQVSMVKLLQIATEKWLEDSIGKPPEQVAQYHGAILRVRELLAEIERDITPPADRPTGGFET